MQDSSLYSQINQAQPQFPEQEQLKCPRCESTNTKFCYYNNYNLSQPRHFCKSCKRYWTKGGALRNIPVGGASRKTTKRNSSATSAAAASKRPASVSVSAAKDKLKASENVNNSGEIAEILPLQREDFGGQFENLSFSSLLGSTGDHYVGLLDGLGGTNGHFANPGSGQDLNPGLEIGCSSSKGDGFLNMQGGGGGADTSWGGDSGGVGGNEWPDLAIYTPGSNFQ